MSEFNVAGPFQALVTGIAPGKQAEPAWARTARILRELADNEKEAAYEAYKLRESTRASMSILVAGAYIHAADIVEREGRAEG